MNDYRDLKHRAYEVERKLESLEKKPITYDPKLISEDLTFCIEQTKVLAAILGRALDNLQRATDQGKLL